MTGRLHGAVGQAPAGNWPVARNPAVQTLTTITAIGPRKSVAKARTPSVNADSIVDRVNTNGSNPTDVFPGLLNPATWAALAAEYQRLTQFTLVAVDQEGRFLCGGSGLSECARSESCRPSRLLAVTEALRWGEPSVTSCSCGFALWAVCPNNKVSGNKRLGAKTRPVANRLSTGLRMAAQSLTRVEGPLGDWYRRMRAKLGPAAAVTATAHKIARILSTMVKNRTAFDPAKLGNPELTRLRKERTLRKQAAAFGFSLQPLTPQAA